jgi:diazepam-binding inhibitor (GABA receptor modulating acyl-CoA-binding protein)
MTVDDEFAAAKARSAQLPKTPADSELLELYALYKQATEGDVRGSRPGVFDFRARMKYDAWAKRAGLSTEDARQAYVVTVARLEQKYA